MIITIRNTYDSADPKGDKEKAMIHRRGIDVEGIPEVAARLGPGTLAADVPPPVPMEVF